MRRRRRRRRGCGGDRHGGGGGEGGHIRRGSEREGVHERERAVGKHSSRVVGWRRASFPKSPTRRCLLALARWTSKRVRVACDCKWGSARGHVGLLSEGPWTGSLWRALSVRGACRVSSLVSRTHQAKQSRARGDMPGDTLVGKETERRGGGAGIASAQRHTDISYVATCFARAPNPGIYSPSIYLFGAS